MSTISFAVNGCLNVVFWNFSAPGESYSVRRCQLVAPWAARSASSSSGLKPVHFRRPPSTWWGPVTKNQTFYFVVSFYWNGEQHCFKIDLLLPHKNFLMITFQTKHARQHPSPGSCNVNKLEITVQAYRKYYTSMSHPHISVQPSTTMYKPRKINEAWLIVK